MRIIFAGTPDIAATVLQRLIDSEHEIVSVITRPDAPVGRRRRLTPSPVAALAEANGLPIVRAGRVTPETIAEVNAQLRLTPRRSERRDPSPEGTPVIDLGVVVAYGAILPDALLKLPQHGWINLHVSLLPRWRGAAPVQRAIAAGDAPLGFSVIDVTSELDAGNVYLQRTVPGLERATAGEVLEQMGEAGAEAVIEVADALSDGTASTAPQRGEVTIAPKLTRDFGRIDWSQPACTVFNRWRAATPEPGAWTTLDGEPFKILQMTTADTSSPGLDLPALAAPGTVVRTGRRALAAAADDWLELLVVQPAGKRAMAARDWANGLRQPAEYRDAAQRPAETLAVLA